MHFIVLFKENQKTEKLNQAEEYVKHKMIIIILICTWMNIDIYYTISLLLFSLVRTFVHLSVCLFIIFPTSLYE